MPKRQSANSLCAGAISAPTSPITSGRWCRTNISRTSARVHDRRSIHVRLTEKGIKLRDRLTAMHRRHAEMLSQAAVSLEDLQAASAALRRLERFWIRAGDFVQRPPQFAA